MILPDAPIKFNRDFRLYNTDNNTAGLLSLNRIRYQTAWHRYFTGAAIMPHWYLPQPVPTLPKLSWRYPNPLPSSFQPCQATFVYLMLTPTNTCSTSTNRAKTWSILIPKAALTRFWDSYNLYILLGILILILLSFLYVRSRVQKSQDLFND
jgi:hypothetical protein